VIKGRKEKGVVGDGASEVSACQVIIELTRQLVRISLPPSHGILITSMLVKVVNKIISFKLVVRFKKVA